MKRLLMLMVAVGLAGYSHAREFTSADGEKTVIAEFVNYNPRTGDVTLRMRDGRNLITKADLFSEDDQAFFKEQYQNRELEGAFSVRCHDKLDHMTEIKDRLVITKTNADYVFTIKNESDVALENLTVKYWVVTERYNRGDETNEISSGEGRVAELPAEGEAEISGPHIVLTTGAAPIGNVKDENQYSRLLAEAAKYGRDRNLGWRVEVYSSDGKELLVDSSSVRVDRALGKDDKRNKDNK